MSTKSGGTKRRRYSNMRRPNAMRWACPKCGAALRETPHDAPGPRLRYGDPCPACKVPSGAARCVSCGGLMSNPSRRGCQVVTAHGNGRG